MSRLSSRVACSSRAQARGQCDRQVAGALADRCRASHRARPKALDRRPFVGVRLPDDQIVLEQLVVALGVCHRGLEQLAPVAGHLTRGEGEDSACLLHRLAADVAAHHARLARGGAHVAGVGAHHAAPLRFRASRFCAVRFGGDFAARFGARRGWALGHRPFGHRLFGCCRFACRLFACRLFCCRRFGWRRFFGRRFSSPACLFFGRGLAFGGGRFLAAAFLAAAFSPVGFGGTVFGFGRFGRFFARRLAALWPRPAARRPPAGRRASARRTAHRTFPEPA